MSCSGSLATMIAGVLAVSSSDSITAGMAALSVVYAHYVSTLISCKVIRISMHTTRYTLARLIINKDRPA